AQVQWIANALVYNTVFTAADDGSIWSNFASNQDQFLDRYFGSNKGGLGHVFDADVSLGQFGRHEFFDVRRRIEQGHRRVVVGYSFWVPVQCNTCRVWTANNDSFDHLMHE